MPTEGLPESNGDEVARKLVLKATDLDGSGLVDVMRLLLAQAEEIQRVHRRSATFDQNPPADPLADRAEVLGAYQEAVYEPICIEWLLSRVMKQLAEQLKFRVYQSQQRSRALAQITYTETGQLENFRLRTPTSST